LVGAGGSGKTMLAAALAHRVAPHFSGRVDWFRIGAWDHRTLLQMLALRFHTKPKGVRSHLAKGGPHLLVLDNHEDDRATAWLLDELAGTRTSFLITARRCLLAGVLVYPVVPPLVTAQESAFPRVADLTRRLRWNPLALDIADAIVASRGATVSKLGRFLDEHGIASVHVIEHEDDLPEVALLVAWAWPKLTEASKAMLAVLAHMEGDHVDGASLATLAHASPRALAPLQKWHLVQEPIAGRYTLHAVVRHAVRKRTTADPRAFFEHYVALLERHPDRLDLDQTNLFAAMDYAHRSSDLDAMLRIERLLEQR